MSGSLAPLNVEKTTFAADSVDPQSSFDSSNKALTKSHHASSLTHQVLTPAIHSIVYLSVSEKGQ
jgi:hypothetical protein